MRLAAMTCCGLLIGCAPLIEAPDGHRMRATSSEFRDYVAAVFRRHNRATVAIYDAIEAIPDEASPLIATLDRSDARMMDICELLDQLAIARRDGDDLGFARMKAAAATVPACDEATSKAEILLEQLLRAR